MKNFETLEQIKEAAICINHPIKVRYPQWNKEEFVSIDKSTLADKTYETNNSTVAFVCDDSLYVIPYMKPVMDILVRNGFTQRCMYVPFSNGDYPINWQSKWNDLKGVAREVSN